LVAKKKNKKAGLIAFEMALINDDLVLTKEESKFNRPLNCHKRRKQVQSSSELAQNKKASSIVF
jgi:hypothetical protein